MNTFLGYAVLAVFFIIAFIASALILLLGEGHLGGLLGYPIFFILYFVYYYILKQSPNTKLLSRADFNTFAGYTFIIQAVFGIFLIINIISTKEPTGGLRWLAFISLLGPWGISQIYRLTNNKRIEGK